MCVCAGFRCCFASRWTKCFRLLLRLVWLYGNGAQSDIPTAWRPRGYYQQSRSKSWLVERTNQQQGRVNKWTTYIYVLDSIVTEQMHLRYKNPHFNVSRPRGYWDAIVRPSGTPGSTSLCGFQPNLVLVLSILISRPPQQSKRSSSWFYISVNTADYKNL